MFVYAANSSDIQSMKKVVTNERMVTSNRLSLRLYPFWDFREFKTYILLVPKCQMLIIFIVESTALRSCRFFPSIWVR